MRLFGLWFVLFLMMVSLPAWAEPLGMDAVNDAGFSAEAGTGLTVKAQVLLDRKRYSPGVIDGHAGEATGIALKGFQADNGLEPSGKLDEASFAKLTEADSEPVLTRHTISAEDVKGPFVEKIPEDIAEMAALDRMAFTSARELLAERFHMDEDLLTSLNPNAEYKEGEEIVVAAVEGAKEGRSSQDASPVERIVVDKSEHTLRVFGKDGALVALYPATIGSEENPAPDGELKVTSVAKDPTWNYDPKLKLEGDKDRPDTKMTIAAGPNNPVGAVWIDLSKEHFGIHGTPQPEKVGKNLSSGCVRLTNWDALELAGMVKKGMPVVFEQ